MIFTAHGYSRCRWKHTTLFMRQNNVSLKLVPVDGGEMIEGKDGRVLARDGQVYIIEITNHGPRRQIVDVRVDGKLITDSGLVIESFSRTRLERPTTPGEHGRFTVCAEGNEEAFGPDGGRANEDLGLVEVLAREELYRPFPVRPLNPFILRGPQTPYAWPTWGTIVNSGSLPMGLYDGGCVRGMQASYSAQSVLPQAMNVSEVDIARAAGTGLSGHSAQQFRSVEVGPLSDDVTHVALRLVIGTETALRRIRPIDGSRSVPARPVARP